MAVNAGNEIMVTSQGGDQITVSKFSVADGDQKRTVSTRVDEVIRAVVELGGTYPDVVQALQEAKNSGALASRFEVDALPEAGRAYDRVVEDEATDGKKDEGKKDDGKEPAERVVKATPGQPRARSVLPENERSSPHSGGVRRRFRRRRGFQGETKPKKGFFGKMFGG